MSPPDHRALGELQRWMMEAITHPEGLSAGLARVEGGIDGLERRVLPSPSLSALDRLDIYAEMYFLRLVEILEGEYPTVLRLLGPERFDAMARRFLGAHPSRSYRLDRLSAPFPAWLRAEGPEHAFAADVAEVERAMEEVFDATAPNDPLPPERVQSIPQESWSTARLDVTPAHRLLKLDHPVNGFITAVREDRHEDVPAAATAHVLVWRQGWRIWRKDQHPAQAALLGALARAAPLGEAVRSVATSADLADTDPEWFIGRLGEWFREWSQDGLFTAIVTA